jgi:hypothetical protein
VLPLGLPESSLPALIGDLAANNQTAIATVPGITPQIIGAGVGGLFKAYSLGFRFVWVAAGCFMVLAAICKFNFSSCTLLSFACRVARILKFCVVLWRLLVQEANRDLPAGAVFLVDPVKEFNMHIDAPAEKEEDLFS